ncbi:hypothetical protein [Flagellimonas sp. HSM57]|uniref:hypothetical protein n=1 Tax=Flagellimonas sp. HSM57 TaxID=2654675 RepID=UPI0013D39A87|nr:hypothetical protein [Flagellimonas sp. HSM57]
MKKTIILFVLIICPVLMFSQVKVGSNPDVIDLSSILELESSNKALVLTRLTSAQMQSINPLNGAVVYNTDTSCIHYYNGMQWINLCDGSNTSNFTFVDNNNGTFSIFDGGDLVFTSSDLTGPQGVSGNDGADGAQGPAGPQGVPGNDGADGAQGPAGPIGPQGIPGNDGADGAQGPAGPQGIPGNDGADGAQGPAGPQGVPGSDGADGAQGPAGPAGPQGVSGNDGADGAQGPAGPQGVPGNDGADGAQGPQGIPGNDGADGAQGPQGIPGNDGADGAQGPAGPQGPVGPPQTLSKTDNTITLSDGGGSIDETITNLTQDTSTGVITYTNEEATPQTANTVGAETNNQISVGANGGAFYISPIRAFGKVSSGGGLVKGTAGVTVTKLSGNGYYRVNLPPGLVGDADYIIQLAQPSRDGSGNDDPGISYRNQTASSFEVIVGDNDNGGSDRNRFNSEFMFTVLDL